MLSGDNETAANIIADSVGIKEVIANVSPKDKSNKIKELKDELARMKTEHEKKIAQKNAENSLEFPAFFFYIKNFYISISDCRLRFLRSSFYKSY